MELINALKAIEKNKNFDLEQVFEKNPSLVAVGQWSESLKIKSGFYDHWVNEIEVLSATELQALA